MFSRQRVGGKSYLSEAGREGFVNNLGEVKGFRECDHAVQFSGSVEVTSEPFEADAQNLRQGEKFDSLEKIFFFKCPSVGFQISSL